MLLHYLVKLKMPLLPFSHYSCHRNIHQNSFILLNVIHIVWHILPQHDSELTTTACHVQDLLRFLCLSAEQYVSSLSAHSLSVSVSHLNLLKSETPMFISSDLWPQHPYLNSLNYKICSEMQQRVYLKKFIM